MICVIISLSSFWVMKNLWKQRHLRYLIIALKMKINSSRNWNWQKNLHYFFSVFKSLYPINVGYNACKAVFLKKQWISKWNFFYNALTFLKRWEIILFPNLKMHCFSAYDQVGIASRRKFQWIRYITFSHDIILLPRQKKSGNSL